MVYRLIKITHLPVPGAGPAVIVFIYQLINLIDKPFGRMITTFVFLQSLKKLTVWTINKMPQ